MSPAWAWTTSCLVEVDASLPAHGTGTAGQSVCSPQTSSLNEFGHSASIRRTFWPTGSGWRAAAYTSKTAASRFLPAGIVSLAARNSVTEYVPSISTNSPPKAQFLDFFFTRTGPNRSFRRTGPHKTAYVTTRGCLRPPPAPPGHSSDPLFASLRGIWMPFRSGGAGYRRAANQSWVTSVSPPRAMGGLREAATLRWHHESLPGGRVRAAADVG